MLTFCIRVLNLAVVFVCLLALPAGTGEARADILNRLFPGVFGPEDKGPKPEETLIAPFAQNTAKPRALSETERKMLQSPENAVPLNQPHRNDAYIAAWAAEKVVAAFMIDTAAMNEQVKKMDSFFVPAGKQDYMNYLSSAQILESLQQEQRKISAFVKTDPQILNQGNFGGVYRWLVDVPVTISIMPLQMDSYAGRNARIQPLTQSFVIRVQVGRTAGFADGIAIERWTAPGASS